MTFGIHFFSSIVENIKKVFFMTIPAFQQVFAVISGVLPVIHGFFINILRALSNIPYVGLLFAILSGMLQSIASLMGIGLKVASHGISGITKIYSYLDPMVASGINGVKTGVMGVSSVLGTVKSIV
jgi:hypothetical protein